MSRSLFVRKPVALLLQERGTHGLRPVLGPLQLTSLGVGAIIGAGIFVVIGLVAKNKAGPATMLSFVIAGTALRLCCPLLCRIRLNGAGRRLRLHIRIRDGRRADGVDHRLGSVAGVWHGRGECAHGWSHYFTDFVGLLGLQFPRALSNAPFDFNPGTGQFFSTGAIIDLPAFVITALLTLVLVTGIRESASFNALMVIIKLAVVLLVIAVGVFYIDTNNWQPFAPYGYSGISFFGKTILGGHAPGGEPLGVMAGAAIVFYAYIGFDSVSTHAEETRRPSRDVPIGILASLAICTALYISVGAVLTGMVPYDKIDIDAPLAHAFRQAGLPWAHFLISLGALAGITSVLMVLMLSQPRIMLAMARDGLLPSGFFGAIHERFRTPWKSTILTGTLGRFVRVHSYRLECWRSWSTSELCWPL